MIIKKHIVDRKLILAVCDSSLLGKKFEENDLQLDLTSNFYKGKETSEEDILKIYKKAYIVNIVGEKSIDFFKKLGMLTEGSVIKISNIPHAELLIGKES